MEALVAVELTGLGDSIGEDGFPCCCLGHLSCIGNSGSGGYSVGDSIGEDGFLCRSLHRLHLCSDTIWYIRRIGLPISSFLLLLAGDRNGGPTVPDLDDSRQSTHMH
jgi:hypothetical protein